MTAPDRLAEEVEKVLVDSGVTANTWQSAARRLADENRRLRRALDAQPGDAGDVLPCCRGVGACQAPPDIGPCAPPAQPGDAEQAGGRLTEAEKAQIFEAGTNALTWGDVFPVVERILAARAAGPAEQAGGLSDWLDGFRAHRDGDLVCPHGYGKGDHHWESGDCLMAASAGGHDCSMCEDCIHDGLKCCGCYDGACCQ